jgi:murein DD-endopeptidase MepM/ murein hydrolase activator NlpD
VVRFPDEPAHISKNMLRGGDKDTPQFHQAPAIWPVEHAQRQVISPFGPRGRSGRLHKGIDIKAPHRTPLVATADGVVSYAGSQRGYGKVIKIDHGNGLTTLYAHLTRVDVKQGQPVARGATIGLLGRTGNASTPHVHYEVIKDDRVVNPAEYLPGA